MHIKKVSIIGAGFIGINLIDACLKQRYDIRVLDRGECPPGFIGKIKWVKGEFDSLEKISSVVEGAEVVFHLISNTVPGDQVSFNVSLLEILSQTFQLLNTCKQNGVKRVVFISSSSVYGTQKEFPIPETALPNPISAHGIQKITLEHCLRLYHYEYNLDCKIMRLSNPYGEGQNIYGKQGFIAILLRKLIEKKPVVIHGDGKTIRDFVHISDVVQACFLLATTDSKKTIFNIGSGKGIKLNEVVTSIEKILGRTIPVEHSVQGLHDIPFSVLDITKAVKNLGFRPIVSFKDGLTKTLLQNSLIT